MGAGLVTVACPASLADILEVKCTEAMPAPIPDTSERSLAANADDLLLELANARDAVGLGPGLGRSAETVKLVRSVVARIRRPLALDADGLFPFECPLSGAEAFENGDSALRTQPSNRDQC